MKLQKHQKLHQNTIQKGRRNRRRNEEGILRRIYIFPELRQKIINDLRLREKIINNIRLKEENYWWSKINRMIEYQKIMNLLNSARNQTAKFKTKNWIEINDESHGTYNTNKEIRFKTSVLRTCFCKHSDFTF